MAVTMGQFAALCLLPPPTSLIQEHSFTARFKKPLFLPPSQHGLCGCGDAVWHVVQQVSTTTPQYSLSMPLNSVCSLHPRQFGPDLRRISHGI